MAESFAFGDCIWWDAIERGKVCEGVQHGEGIVEVTEGVGEGRVPLFDDVVEGELRLVQRLEAFSRAVVPASNVPFELFGEDFVVPEFLEDGLVQEVLDVAGLEVARRREWLGPIPLPFCRGGQGGGRGEVSPPGYIHSKTP